MEKIRSIYLGYPYYCRNHNRECTGLWIKWQSKKYWLLAKMEVARAYFPQQGYGKICLSNSKLTTISGKEKSTKTITVDNMAIYGMRISSKEAEFLFVPF
jgi:hypothetical protein